MLIPNGRGSYVMKVDFVGGGPTELPVDSGAEESVCPWEWGVHFGCKNAEVPMRLRDASCKVIPHGGAVEEYK
eukprot:7585052-Karenia_brevis.AAC.1